MTTYVDSDNSNDCCCFEIGRQTMFEKEADEFCENLDESKVKDFIKDVFNDGAEYGYNKAKEKIRKIFYNGETNEKRLIQISEFLEETNNLNKKFCRWMEFNGQHNLRENPNDLPKETKNYFILCDTGEIKTKKFIVCINKETGKNEGFFEYQTKNTVLEWKEISKED